MELKSSARSVTFAGLQARLIAFVNSRIKNGDFTERGLAKIIGISQPQIHNVLKGARKLRPELADRLIRKFEMSVLDLLEPGEIYEEMLSRGRVDAGKSFSGLIADHLPPRKFPAEGAVRKPARRELRSTTTSAGKVS